jgi:hypothetical protein
VETIIHETLGDVLLGDANVLFVLREINNKLVSNPTLLASVSDLEFLGKLISHVVGVEDGMTTAI